MTKILKENLEKEQHRMKFYVVRKRTKKELELGDWVYLKLQPYKQTSIALRRNLKLTSKYYIPYQKKIGSHMVLSIDPPVCSDNGQPLVEPVAILDRRIVKKGNVAVAQVLVQWANLLSEEATWEDYNFIKSQIPNFEP
ncbi:uncharacterized protein LOC142181072 [Nicotiana tabacum]|uniref:Uncharacterized protein LOC142181072 n=1 Tax=Nicotiana tabacum TaxID=4097 RepID=A0AC58UIJ7_TOBAC